MPSEAELQEILNLQSELATLRGEEATEKLAQAFMDSVSQAKEALEGVNKDASSFTEEASEYKEALEHIQDTFDETTDFIKETTKITDQITKGVGQAGAKAKEASELLGKIEAAGKRIEGMKQLSRATASEQLRGLSDLIGEVTGWLEDLAKLIPGLGAFVEIWRLGIESIANTAAILESIVLLRNRQAREAGLDEPYVILEVGADKRSSRIEAILDRLEALGVDMTPPTQSGEGQTIPADVQNALKLGLRDSGMTYDRFMIANAALAASRRKAKGLAQELEGVTGQLSIAGTTGMSEEGKARLETRATELTGQLGDAVADYELQRDALQPTSDAILGYMEQYGSPENAEWDAWMRSQYDASFGMTPLLLDDMKESAESPGTEAAFDAMAAKAVADTEAFETERDSEDTDIEATAPAVAGATAAGMSSGTKKVLLIGGGGILGVLAVGLVIAVTTGGTPDESAASTSTTEAIVQEQSAQQEEPTSSTAATTSSSTTTSAPAVEEMGASADPPSGADAHPAATARSFEVSEGSLIFEVAVNGDGQAMAESEDTKWYQAIFNFDTAEGAFEIRGTWSRGREMEGDAFDQDFTKLNEAVVVGEWIESDTFIITASNYGSDEVPVVVDLYIGVRIDGGDDPDTDYGDQVVWEAEG